MTSQTYSKITWNERLEIDWQTITKLVGALSVPFIIIVVVLLIASAWLQDIIPSLVLMSLLWLGFCVVLILKLLLVTKYGRRIEITEVGIQVENHLYRWKNLENVSLRQDSDGTAHLTVVARGRRLRLLVPDTVDLLQLEKILPGR